MCVLGVCVQYAILTRGTTKGSLKPNTAHIVSTGSRQDNMAPNKMAFPIDGLTGSIARWYPNAVNSSFESNACYRSRGEGTA